jgi:hypothetical protein
MRLVLLALLCLFCVSLVGCKTEPPKETKPTRLEETKPTRPG